MSESSFNNQNEFSVMNPIKTIFTLTLLAMSFYKTDPAKSDESNPPNIVFMFADDLGYADLSCYGHPYAKTPNLDRLASEGTRFAQCYVTGVTCNPSRTGLMTGIHPARYPRYAADFGFGDRVTITELLKKKGYRTGHFGKWHIGPKAMAVNGTCGIDKVEVIGGDHNDVEGRDTNLYKAATQFIRDTAKRGQPFYVNIWGHSTHFPVHAASKLTQPFRDTKVKRSDFSHTMQHKFDECLKIGGDLDNSMRQYLADVYSLDLNVGRVLKTIDELGLSENTIVVFSSDHGPAPVVLGKKGARKYSNNMLGYAGKFRGGKHEQLEGGVRVPFIIRWPGHVPSRHWNQNSVISLIDWMPTLCSIVGIKNLPSDYEGEDVSDIWLGAHRDRTKPLFWKTSAIKSTPAMRNQNWKLHLPLKPGLKPELYDLSIDPSESHNVASDHPTVVTRMSKTLKAWVSTLPSQYEKLSKNRK